MQAPDTAGENADLRLEIAHILFIDVVGYSRLLVTQQTEVLRELNTIVRNCDCFRTAEAAGKLVRLPTGDGMALLFFGSPEEPATCALEVSRALKERPQIQVRMGVHSGPVNRVTDVNDRTNITGGGLNVAQRVMDCGDGGHILLSGHVVDDLAQYPHWRPYLHDLGECEAKHGLRLHVFSLCKDGLGNREIPYTLRRGPPWRKKRRGGIQPITSSRLPLAALRIALLASLLTVAFSLWILFRRPVLQPAAGSLEKSVAVLPFQSFSGEKQDVYFADGIQDEILTDLARLADLKVISRTSVMQYRGDAKRNLREIGKALGVNYAVEGSVQRAEGKVRVIAQLIDARTDAQLWAERYDRAITDVFAIQAEVAEKIVDQLHIKLSVAQRAAIQQRPTLDLVALDLYVRAKDLIERSVFNAPRDDQLLEAITLLEQAIERDANFVEAYFQLAHAHDQVYFIGSDHTAARLALAENAIERIKDIRPDSGEAHLAMAKHLYWCYRDYHGARTELAAIGDKLPNNPWPSLLLGYMDRRQGRWEESTASMEKALQLDPLNFSILQQIAITYEGLRRYPEAIAMVDRALDVAPDDVSTRSFRAALQLNWRGDIKPLRTFVTDTLAHSSGAAPAIADTWLALALDERDPVQAQRALAALPEDGCRDETLVFPREWCEGRAALLGGDTVRAQKAFAEARAEAETLVHDQPGYGEAWCVLGVIDAALGRKVDAIAEGIRATKMLSLDKDSVAGAKAIYYLAVIYTLTGEKEAASEQLERSCQTPAGVSYGDLLLEPFWDPLRGDGRFKKIIASLKPKS